MISIQFLESFGKLHMLYLADCDKLLSRIVAVEVDTLDQESIDVDGRHHDIIAISQISQTSHICAVLSCVKLNEGRRRIPCGTLCWRHFSRPHTSH